MLIVKNKGYVRKYAYGGSGIFSTIGNFFKDLFKKAASNDTISRATAKVIEAGKSAAKELGEHAVEAGKTAAVSAGKKVIDSGINALRAPKTSDVLQTLTPSTTVTPQIDEKSKDILNKLGGPGSIFSLPFAITSQALSAPSDIRSQAARAPERGLTKMVQSSERGLTKESRDSLNRLLNAPGRTININNLLAGAGMRRQTHNTTNTTNAIKIQDLVKKLSGSGLRVV